MAFQRALPGFEQPVRHERTLTIREMPTRYQPCERLKLYGAEALSVSELLDIVAGVRLVGQSQSLLANFGGLGRMAIATQAEFAATGITPATAIRIKAALELGRRAETEEAGFSEPISSPSRAAQVLMPVIGGKEQEHFALLLLNTRHRILTSPTILYKGTVNSINIRIADILREVVRYNATALLTAHNHPSGDPQPSPEDISVAQEQKKACTSIGVDFVDHLILGRSRWVSLKERGVL